MLRIAEFTKIEKRERRPRERNCRVNDIKEFYSGHFDDFPSMENVQLSETEHVEFCLKKSRRIFLSSVDYANHYVEKIEKLFGLYWLEFYHSVEYARFAAKAAIMYNKLTCIYHFHISLSWRPTVCVNNGKGKPRTVTRKYSSKNKNTGRYERGWQPMMTECGMKVFGNEQRGIQTVKNTKDNKQRVWDYVQNQEDENHEVIAIVDFVGYRDEHKEEQERQQVITVVEGIRATKPEQPIVFSIKPQINSISPIGESSKKRPIRAIMAITAIIIINFFIVFGIWLL